MRQNRLDEKNRIKLADLLFCQKPPHWPISSYYCVRSALRTLVKSVPLDKSFSIADLPGLLDQNPSIGKNPKTNQSRILRLAAEHVSKKRLAPWETRKYFERLTLRNINKGR